MCHFRAIILKETILARHVLWLTSTLSVSHCQSRLQYLGCSYHSGLRVSILPPVAESGSQGGGTGLVVEGGPSIINGAVDWHGPHAGGIAVTVAVIHGSTIPWSPDIDAALPTTALQVKVHCVLKWVTFDVSNRKDDKTLKTVFHRSSNVA